MLLAAGCVDTSDSVPDAATAVAASQPAEHEPHHSTAGPAQAVGPWELALDVEVDGPWLDMVAYLELELYSGNFDLEFVLPDGRVRETCGAFGCTSGITIGSRMTITSGLGDDEPAPLGTATVRAWGTGVGEATIGFEALVPA